MRNNNIDLNIEGLDNYYGITSDEATQLANSSANLIASLSKLKRPLTEIETEIKSSCGRKPLLFKKRKEKWESCRNNLLQAKVAEAKQQLPPSTPPPTVSADEVRKIIANDAKANTILGIPKVGFYVGLTVLVLGIGSLITYKIVKNKGANK